MGSTHESLKVGRKATVKPHRVIEEVSHRAESCDFQREFSERMTEGVAPRAESCDFQLELSERMTEGMAPRAESCDFRASFQSK